MAHPPERIGARVRISSMWDFSDALLRFYPTAGKHDRTYDDLSHLYGDVLLIDAIASLIFQEGRQ